MISSDAFAPQENKDPQEMVQGRARRVGEIGKPPRLSDPGAFDEPEGVKAARKMLEEDVSRFYGTLTDYLESQRKACEDLRSDYDFDDRLEKARRRAKAKVHVEVDENGSVVTQAEDGHAEMGICQGWSAQANQLIGAYLFNRLVEGQERPFAVIMRGKRSENRIVEQTLTAVLDDLLKRGRFKKRFHNIVHWCPETGTAVLRYEMARETALRRGPDGTFAEDPDQALFPAFTCWPLEDVSVSHPDAPEAEDQEKVFWVRENVSLYDLEEEEARYMSDRMGGGVDMATGKFRNLDVLREELTEVPAASSDENITTHPKYTLIEYEGSLPILSWVREGILNWDIADHLGARVGDKVGPDPTSDLQMDEWARQLARITHWKVAYLVAGEGLRRPGGEGHQVVLQCEPDRHKQLRNSMYVFGYRKHGTEFYRMSVVDLAGALEDAGDTILNSVLYTAYFNAHPAKVVHKQVLINKSIEEIQKLFSPDGLVEAAPGVSARDIVDLMELPYDQYAFNKMEYLKREFEYTSGASAAAKGSQGSAAESGTLGEIRINEAKANLMLDDIVMDFAREMGRLFRDMLQDVIWEYGEDGFARYAATVSGMPESEIKKAMISIQGIEDEVEITHPMVVMEDRAVLVSLLLQIYQVFGQEVFKDPQEFVGKLMEFAGVRYAEALVDSGESMDPQDEQRQMAMGNMVEPHQTEDFMQHLTTHQQRMEQLMMQPQPANPEWHSEATLTRDHIIETLMLVKQMFEMYEAMATQNGADQVLPGQGSAQMGGGPGQQMVRGTAAEQRPGKKPQPGTDQGNNIRQNARSKPNGSAK